MVCLETTLKRFDEQGEKTGWTYVLLPLDILTLLNPNTKVTFRVKGKIDQIEFSKIAAMPMGGGEFIMPINATLRKKIKKEKGAKVSLQLELDSELIEFSQELMDCLDYELTAKEFFLQLNRSNKNYFTHWINEAKTPATKAKRITETIDALLQKRNFVEMVRAKKRL